MVAGSNPATPTNILNTKQPLYVNLSPSSHNHLLTKKQDLLTKFLNSRRQGLSQRTIEFYKYTLQPFIEYCKGEITPEAINSFLANLNCSTGGKHAYYRGIEVFVNYLVKSGHLIDNPLWKVESPKPSRPILPSLTLPQVQYLIDIADTLRDKCIISLLADSGMRLSEVANIQDNNIDWANNTITIWGKGNIQRKAAFTPRSAKLLTEWLRIHNNNGTVWDIDYRGIQCMLKRLEIKTGLKCNPHTFRRTFASNLHRAGVDIEHIMRLGGWSSLDMVLTYTKSVKFEDSLKHYHRAMR